MSLSLFTSCPRRLALQLASPWLYFCPYHVIGKIHLKLSRTNTKVIIEGLGVGEQAGKS